MKLSEVTDFLEENDYSFSTEHCEDTIKIILSDDVEEFIEFLESNAINPDVEELEDYEYEIDLLASEGSDGELIPNDWND